MRKTILPLIFAAAAGLARAQFSYPGCDSIRQADFTIDTLANRALDSSLREPLKMDFHADANGVNVFFVERGGVLKYIDGKTGEARALGKVPRVSAPNTQEEGLLGIALDPDFGNKKRVYLQYMDGTAFLVARFDLDPATLVLRPASEKRVLAWAGKRDRWSTGGGMRFDAYGDLWIAAGDNMTSLIGPGNPGDLRGSILRIHPEEDGSYSIPRGNFWEAAAAHFDSVGNPGIAARYRDSSLARREIYAKGMRNPYTLTLDPVRRWAAWGDCGPDLGNGVEEDDLATSPGFYGWPFWAGEQVVINANPYRTEPADVAGWKNLTQLDAAGPVNPLDSLPITALPPARKGTYTYNQSCAMAGPIFRYDGDLRSDVKFPPSFNRLWLVSDYVNPFFRTFELDGNGAIKAGTSRQILQGLLPFKPGIVDLQQGPDGALYFVSYARAGAWYAYDSTTGIYRIGYKGSCQDPDLKAERPSPIRVGREAGSRGGPRVTLSPGRIEVAAAGRYTFALYGSDGRAAIAFPADGSRSFEVSRLLAGATAGVYWLRVEDGQGLYRGRIAYLP